VAYLAWQSGTSPVEKRHFSVTKVALLRNQSGTSFFLVNRSKKEAKGGKKTAKCKKNENKFGKLNEIV
jgi:hypothetical protein